MKGLITYMYTEFTESANLMTDSWWEMAAT